MTTTETFRRWTARWIWIEGDPRAQNTFAEFAAEVEISDPAGCQLAISADTRYRLWINGTLVGEGPPQSQPYHQYYDQHDVAALLRPGRNRIAVLVNHLGILPETRGGLLAELVAADGSVLTATGEAWVGRRCAAAGRGEHFRMNKCYPFQERWDLGRDGEPWRIDAPLATWPAAQVLERAPVARPWGHLLPRDIPELERTPLRPVAIQTVEEAIWLENRQRTQDLSVTLSQAGRPLESARIEHAEDLLSGAGGTLLAPSHRPDEPGIHAIHDPVLVLDFGRVVTAQVELELEAEAGATIDLGYAERLVDGHFNNAIECWFADRFVHAGGRATLRPFRWKAFRYLKLRASRLRGELRLHSLRAIEERYPFVDNETEPGFAGEARLEAIDAICRRTIRLCCVEGIYDTPFREAAQWLGDVAAVTLPAIASCYGDAVLPGKFLVQSAANSLPSGLLANVSNIVPQGFAATIPDYSLHWIPALWRHYQFTGDPSWIHRLYPQATRILQAHEPQLNERGLLEDVPYWVFIDWAHVDKRGEISSYNAIFAGALDAYLAMAELRGDAWALEHYGTIRQGLGTAFHRRFFDPARGLYVDCVESGEPSPRCSEHSQIAALRFDLVPDGTADALIERTWGDARPADMIEAQPFFFTLGLEALGTHHRRELGLALTRERWGRMLDRGATSCFEEWTDSGSYRGGEFSGFQRTHSHAWSAGAATFLRYGLTGFRILEPGCTRIALDPLRTGPAYRVRLPTPHGDVVVAWDGSEIALAAPAGMMVELTDERAAVG